MTARQRIRYAIKRLEKQKGWCRGYMRDTDALDKPQSEITLAEVNAVAGCLLGSLVTGREVLNVWKGKAKWATLPNLTAACALLSFESQDALIDWNDGQSTKAPVLRRLRAALEPKATS